jgi:hypothetical protein
MRLQTIEFLKGYGFRCMRYLERYNGFWPSDTIISISEDYRFNIHHPYAESSDVIWGLSCDAVVSADMDFEVCVLTAHQRMLGRVLIVLCCRIIGLFERMQRSVFGVVEIAKASYNQRTREYPPSACSHGFILLSSPVSLLTCYAQCTSNLNLFRETRNKDICERFRLFSMHAPSSRFPVKPSCSADTCC